MCIECTDFTSSLLFLCLVCFILSNYCADECSQRSNAVENTLCNNEYTYGEFLPVYNHDNPFVTLYIFHLQLLILSFLALCTMITVQQSMLVSSSAGR